MTYFNSSGHGLGHTQLSLCFFQFGDSSAGFTYYRLDKLKPMASTFNRTPAKVYNTFDTVIELTYLCCHNALYSLV